VSRPRTFAPPPGCKARAVRLINDIAAQFPHVCVEEAATRIAAHVSRFWESRMRANLRAALAQPDSGLDERAEAAARLLFPG
jgi:hypothetical protein